MSNVTRRTPVVLTGLAVLLLGIVITLAWSAEKETEREHNPAADALLVHLNTSPEKKLAETPGITPDSLKKLMAHRATGAKFTSLVDFMQVTGTTHENLETLLKPFQELESERIHESERKAVPDPSRAKAGRLQKNAGSAPAGEQPPSGEDRVTGTGPIGAVRPNYYSKLPGYEDLDKIDPLKRTEFLETVNREMCSCGCKGETIAFCLVNDPGCPVVKARTKKIYDDIMTKAPR